MRAKDKIYTWEKKEWMSQHFCDVVCYLSLSNKIQKKKKIKIQEYHNSSSDNAELIYADINFVSTGRHYL